MNKTELSSWASKIQKMTESQLIRFETKTLAYSDVDSKAKMYLLKAVNLRKSTMDTPVYAMAVSDDCGGELS